MDNISVRAYKYPSGYRLMPESLLEAIKPLPLTAGLIVSNRCTIAVRPLRDWLKLCDPNQHLSIMILPGRLGIKNGNAYAQFKHTLDYLRPGSIHRKNLTDTIKLDFI